MCDIILSFGNAVMKCAPAISCAPEKTDKAESGLHIGQVAFPFGAYPVRSFVAGYGGTVICPQSVGFVSLNLGGTAECFCIPSYLRTGCFLL